MIKEVILGFLIKRGAMSGYEILQQIRSAQMEEWADIKTSSIYATMRKLDDQDLIVLQTLEKTGNRSRAIYSITPKGCDVFKKLLFEALKKPSIIFPNFFYTGLIFMEELGIDEIYNALEQQEFAILQINDRIKTYQENREKRKDIPAHTQIIFNHIIALCEQQANFINNFKDELQPNGRMNYNKEEIL